MNTTINTAGNAYFNKTFYDRKLLDTAKTPEIIGISFTSVMVSFFVTSAVSLSALLV